MSEKILSLLERSEEALESSRLLLDEGYYDACVSRTYYAIVLCN